MTKTQQALTGLVAAIPGGVLAYLLVMVFLTKADSLKTMTMIMVALTLICAVFVALMPVGMLVLGGRKPKEQAEGKSEAEIEEASGEADVVEDVEDADIEDEEEIETEVAEGIEESDADMEETFEMESSDVDIMAESSDEISTGDSSLEEMESIDFEDEEEEPKPKKKKK